MDRLKLLHYTYSSLQLTNLTVQNVEVITKKRRGGSRRMYWERTSVPVSGSMCMCRYVYNKLHCAYHEVYDPLKRISHCLQLATRLIMAAVV